jgi:GNAT superfamily N-acetyltransferase
MGTALFDGPGFHALEMGAEDIPALQRFFEENPDYFQTVAGEAPGPDMALREFEDRPPADWPWDGKWTIRFDDPSGAMVAMADVVRNLLAPGVWHIGLFIVATRLHGLGEAGAIYGAMEDWMRAGGARWLRLGAAVDNPRAGRFWERMGYAEVRRREGIAVGWKVNTIRTMLKSLSGESVAEYLRRVPRDRPDSP